MARKIWFRLFVTQSFIKPNLIGSGYNIWNGPQLSRCICRYCSRPSKGTSDKISIKIKSGGTNDKCSVRLGLIDSWARGRGESNSWLKIRDPRMDVYVNKG